VRGRVWGGGGGGRGKTRRRYAGEVRYKGCVDEQGQIFLLLLLSFLFFCFSFLFSRLDAFNLSDNRTAAIWYA